VTLGTAAGYVELHAGGTGAPPVSTLNYRAGQTRANNAVVLLGPAGDFRVASGQPAGTVQVIVDVNGYFQ